MVRHEHATDGSTSAATCRRRRATQPAFAIGLFVAALATIGIGATGAAATDVGVSAIKLIVVDKSATVGKAKVVFVAKDAAVTKGMGTDVETIEVLFDAAYENGNAAGGFVVPQGSANGWLANKTSVAKFVNKSAPVGSTQAKVVVVKPTKLLKLVGKGLGDVPLDVFAGGDPGPQGVRTRYCVTNGGEEYCHCSLFPSCAYKLIAADSGAKLVCKRGEPTACPECSAGEIRSCGSDVGECVAGTETCVGGVFGPCVGEVVPSTEVCDGLDNDCNGTVDDGLVQTCGSSIGECMEGTQTCVDGVFGPCVGEVLPSAEVCDGLDNDCDGVVDDGNPGGGASCRTGQYGVCADGTVTCSGGTLVCEPDVAPSAEVCDGLDNDCDGMVDEDLVQACGSSIGECMEGTQTCVDGVFGPCFGEVRPSTEVCDGRDNDCDGVVDNGNPGGGASCLTGQYGVCADGTVTCSGGTLVCEPDVAPSAEVCDGLDNDCDGMIDDGDPGGGVACTTAYPGVCADGTTACTGGTLVCTLNTTPSPEVCDGLDNDCNGVVDDGNPGGGAFCRTGQPGVCADGTTTCTGGSLVCTPLTSPSAEVCDGLDNDCDGVVDNGDPGGGVACTTGRLGVCADGTTACTGGTLVCTQTTFPSAEVCDGLDNDCDGVVDDGNPGGGATCSTGEPGVCADGIVTCCTDASVGCTPGTLTCVERTGPSAEVCDGLDNDCDGVVDNGNPGGGGTCLTGLPGVCGGGTFVCTDGALVCTPLTSPSAEVCDGLDNDCNGFIDDGNPGGGASCSTGLPGVCADGTTQCTGGGLVCRQTTFPSTEICDGLDNNCDGRVDEGC